MQKKAYTIRVMSRKEVDLAVEWAGAEGWNPGLHDANPFYAADPSGFLCGCLGDELIATVSVVKYGASFGFFGFYIVKPEYRHQGFGLKLWMAGTETLRGRVLGLDGVAAQQANYSKIGYQLAYRSIRHQGTGGGPAPATKDIVPLATVPFEALCAYDRPFFPEPRPAFLKSWISQPQTTALGLVQNGRLAGYAAVRPCRSGYKIGPLYADNAGLAEQLFLTLKAAVPERVPIFLDTPEANPAAVALAQRHHMTVSFETVRMYQGQHPMLPLERLYGVTSFELG
jgi:hypothetical protein